jgi:2-phosphosulfolactate phosphatase
MEFRRTMLANCAMDATGVVIVIDVLRAFTTAAFAFNAGAEAILLVSSVEEALGLRAQLDSSLIMGEVGGLHVPGFNFGNSPAEIARQDLSARTLIQRTSAGTQGAVRSTAASTLFAASFVNARATALRLSRLNPPVISFVLTGLLPDGRGEEDAACADYLEALLTGLKPDPAPFLNRVRSSRNGRIFADPAWPDFPSADLELACQADRFQFAMQIERRDGLIVMRSVPIQEENTLSESPSF